eukprot:1797714-Amphidinium_carterae.1
MHVLYIPQSPQKQLKLLKTSHAKPPTAVGGQQDESSLPSHRAAATLSPDARQQGLEGHRPRGCD